MGVGQGVHRVAMLSVHTSPLDTPGAGDAGGLNVYVDQTARHLARRGVEVDVFTRATRPGADAVPVEPGYTVRHVPAGPAGPVPKGELRAALGRFAAGVAGAVGSGERASYDVVHSHYWLAGLVGRELAGTWRVPLVHSAHTWAIVKNATRAPGEPAEPPSRLAAERRVADEADLLVVSTRAEAARLMCRYGVDPARTVLVHPGADIEVFHPDGPVAPRSDGEVLLVFAGRVQAHKGPAVLVRAAAELRRRYPGRSFRVLIVGDVSGPSDEPARIRTLAAELGVADMVQLRPAMPPADLACVLRAADAVAVPSHSESFGLVALEAQACGTPVVAARVGGLPVAIRHGESGLLVDGHDAEVWASALSAVTLDRNRRARMAAAARAHAARFTWGATVDGLLRAYRGAAGGTDPGGRIDVVRSSA